MTSVADLIASVTPYIPFSSKESAQSFLDQYGVNDQAALISALYIGRDHLHVSNIPAEYVPSGRAFDRSFITGCAPNWDIAPADYANIMYEKNSSLHTYYEAFIRCTQASDYSLDNF